MRSLLNLPTELLTEIINYYPELFTSLDARVRGVPSGQFVGNDTLRSLSQTCRVLRNIFLPALWKRVHALPHIRTQPKRTVKKRSKVLERRMIGIEKTPYVASLIRSLTITLVECNMYNWQPVAHFVRVLDLLPHLQSLTITEIESDMVSLLESTCAGRTYPSVEALALPPVMAPLLCLFPSVQTLTRSSDPNLATVFFEPKKVYEHVHTINNLTVDREVVNGLRKSLPHVQCFSLWKCISLDSLRLLNGMDALNDLRVRYHPQKPASYYYPYYNRDPGPALNGVIAAAERVLLTSKAKGRKVLRIQLMQSEEVISEETVFIVGGHDE